MQTIYTSPNTNDNIAQLSSDKVVQPRGDVKPEIKSVKKE